MRIENAQRVIDLLGAWNPSDLVYITALSFEARRLRIESLWQSRAMRTWLDEEAPCSRVVLEFTGAGDLALAGFCLPMQVIGFEIEDIHERQWESIRFLIDDYENGVIKFVCEVGDGRGG